MFFVLLPYRINIKMSLRKCASLRFTLVRNILIRVGLNISYQYMPRIAYMLSNWILFKVGLYEHAL